ncbi:hypothetical protein B0T24DRAFT_595309 [Lasiosphaeria ovina]|uniref:Uncharacterized protein n=1 Tax=Lasiosphaeria ovina TaxID=92902 RepID=A0AAE0K794_9PEZI|nr:hypothetical protein B0T24DRAFT_595309 [Lasiosphaeria ovina]
MSKSVKFRSSPTGGSPTYEDRLSDSGVGSFSGSDTRTAHPDRSTYIVTDYNERHYSSNIYTLQNQLKSAEEGREKYKRRTADLERKAAELESLLAQARKEIKDIDDESRKAIKNVEAQSRAIQNRNETLVNENAQLNKEVKELKEKMDELKMKNRELKQARRKSTSSPVMSGALPADSSDEKTMRRSQSKRRSKNPDREKERDKEPEQQDLDTERLRRRFEGGNRADESDATKSSSNSSKGRRRNSIYTEPLGHGAPRPQATIPQSPSRSQYSYTNSATPFTQPQYSNHREPATGNIPRAAHPSVFVNEPSPFAPAEDGSYKPYPLVVPKSSRDRR